jgi:hypothetical protein
MTGGFQQQVYSQPAAAVAGNRASSNPIATFSAGPGGLISGVGGVTVGKFAWVYPPDDPNGGYQVALPTSLAPGGSPTVVPAGLVPNDQQAQNSPFLSNAGMTILQGYQMYLVTQGDWWVVNAGATVPIPNYSKAYAAVSDGSVFFANPGVVFGGASATGSSIAANSTAISMTGSIADDILTVTAVSTGTLYPGTTLTGPTGVATGTRIVSQLTPLLSGETAGGVGRYLLSIGQQTVASGTVVGTYGILTIGTATGTFVIGDVLTGTNVVAGTQITANLTGTGGTGGTMVVSNNTVVSSTTITASTAVETKWVATSSGPLNAIVKISSWQP